jgi:type I restriction enzyme S subunit
MANVLTDTFDLWTTAQNLKTSNRGLSASNQSLLGIKKLRELILDLAVSGKLVPQNANDEHASVLLKKTAVEKDKLISNGKNKEHKLLLAISENEKTFNLPIGWTWERFGNISLIERGGSPRPIESYLTDDPDGLNWIKIGDTEIGGKYITSTREKISREGLSKTRMVYPGDFLLTNSMSFGRPYITKIEGCIHDGWLRIHPPRSLNKDYLYQLLSSSYVFQFFRLAAAGAVVLNLNAEKVRELPVPIPPLAEQHRIVTKVDELMALCDLLEQQQSKSNDAHQTLVDILLGTLTKAENPAAFDEAWQRISNHFDTILTTEHSIDQLKQTILQLAVMGKLVPQNPDDEPASELLKKIAKEKAKFVKEGKIKKQASLAEITDDEKTFELPKSWEWVRIGDASLFTEYGLSEMTFDGIKGVPVLKMGDIQDGNVILGGQKLVPNNVPGLPTLLLKKWDLLYNRTNSAELVGKTGIFDGEDDSYTFASYLIRIRCSESCILPQYLNLAMNEPSFRKTQIEPHLKQQCGQANVNGTILKNMCVPIPPHNEQYRIINKVDELFALCDALKERIREAQALQNQLAVAVVEQAV